MPKTAEKAERIKRDLSGDLFDVNHVTRRMFRCWLDGSYLGYEHYQANLDFLKSNHRDQARLTMFVICEFVDFTAHDASCSRSYAKKVIVETVGKEKLERLNKYLVDDALDLIADWLKEVA